MHDEPLPICRHRGRQHGLHVMCRSDRATRVGRGLALLDTCATCPHADVPHIAVALHVDDALLIPGVAPPPVSADTPSIPCRHRSLNPLRTETADLCGLRGQTIAIYACDFTRADGTQPHSECALHRYCSRQSIPVCYACDDARA